MVLTPSLRLEQCLIYKQLHHHREKIQVGTFIATIDFEEGKSMADSHPPARKSTIMVVDDEPELVTVVCLMLEKNGFNVRCAYSGQQVFADLEEQKPDLIILDVMMPEMDGLEVLRRLKSAPETSSIPVMMLTARDQPEDILRGYKTGADFYIPKPFTKHQLLDGINSILN
jgi:DNA-binding response OmpR family regulator